MGRTTLSIDEPLLRKLKATAAKRGITLAALVNQLLRQAITTQASSRGYELKLKGWEGKLQPGVDLCDRDKLFDLMDGR